LSVTVIFRVLPPEEPPPTVVDRPAGGNRAPAGWQSPHCQLDQNRLLKNPRCLPIGTRFGLFVDARNNPRVTPAG
jgi:hypothetical protein